VVKDQEEQHPRDGWAALTKTSGRTDATKFGKTTGQQRINDAAGDREQNSGGNW